MIQLSDAERQYFAQRPNLKIRPRQVKCHVEFDATIPSDLFPLSKGEIRLFDCCNTAQADFPELKQVFDSLIFQTGCCYTNTEALVNVCRATGIKNVYPYAGWIIGPDGCPLHHAWAVFEQDGNSHLLDGGNLMGFEFYERIKNYPDSTKEAVRRTVVDTFEDMKDLPNSEKAMYGFCHPSFVYVGVRTTPNEASLIWNRLCDKYPQHPAYQQSGQNQYGASRTQEMMKERGLV